MVIFLINNNIVKGQKILYIFLNSLGFLGFVSLTLLTLILFLIVKFIFFTDPIIGKNILGYESICGEADTTSLANKKCQNLMTIYWLMVVGFGTFIISLITL